MKQEVKENTNMIGLFKSLAGFQSEVPIIHKGSQGYGYSYTDLADITRTISPILKKHNLGYYQNIIENSLHTVVFHTESGESIESKVTIMEETLKGQNKFQALGSAITYLRRYSLSCMLGLVTDKDMDSNTIENKLESCKSINELNNLYSTLDANQKANTQHLFTKRKEELTKGNNVQP